MKYKASIIITSFNEPLTVKKAISSILEPNENIWNLIELIIVAPDNKTLSAANSEIKKFPMFKNFRLLEDRANGKPAALNLAVSEAQGEILVLTDGDVYLNSTAIKSLLNNFNKNNVGGVSGQPVSASDNGNRFNFYSKVFCNAAHAKRLSKEYVHMSGYIYAIRNFKALFPIPEELRSEDAYISMWIRANRHKINYEPEAIAYVKFPDNYKDWMKQKTRSLGGAIQLKIYTAQFPQINRNKSRSISEDLKMALFPIKMVNSFMEIWYAIGLYPLRLWLWVVVYYNHLTGKYSEGMWERIGEYEVELLSI